MQIWVVLLTLVSVQQVGWQAHASRLAVPGCIQHGLTMQPYLLGVQKLTVHIYRPDLVDQYCQS